MMRFITKVVAMLPACSPALAFAHAGKEGGSDHGLSFISGLLHPLTGADHLIAMLLVGIWSAMNTRRWWLAPLVFAGLLLVGALAAMAGVNLSGTEYIVSTSLLGLGAMVALQMKLPAAAGALVIGSFAIFHGLAHGAELAHSLSALSGMVMATAALHIAGLCLGWLIIRSSIRQGVARMVGGCASLVGIGLLAGLI